MKPTNVELKAKSSNQDKIRNILKNLNADYKGIDHQIDIYYNTKNGRLKLRKGNIENKLIFYERDNKSDSKESKIILYKSQQPILLGEILSKSLGEKTIVDKQREIYFIDNVKFHIDNVKDLGTFVEIEAIDNDGSIGIEKLKEQCNYYKNLFEIKENDLIPVSYSDLIMQKIK